MDSDSSWWTGAVRKTSAPTTQIKMSSFRTREVGSGATLSLTLASLKADGGLRINVDGTLSGYGSLAGNLTNAGTLTIITPGYSLSVQGNYTQASTGVLNLEQGPPFGFP